MGIDMTFRAFVQELQALVPLTEEEVHAGGELGVADTDDVPSPEEVPSNVVSEMAVATAPGAKLTRIKDDKFKDYDLRGFHNISIDGEHAGVMAKWQGQPNSYKSSGHHYVIKPTLDGHFNRGSWKPLTASELGAYHGKPDDHGMNISKDPTTGELRRYTTDTTDADHKFSDHNTHEQQFGSQQEALDHFVNAHRMAKEFPGGAQERYAAAHDVKERYLQGEQHENKARSVRDHLLQAAWAAKKSYPDHPDLLKAIEDIHNHHAIASSDSSSDLHKRFRDLTYDLPKHSWSSTAEDRHANLRDIHAPWKV